MKRSIRTDTDDSKHMKNILTVIVHQENASGDHDEKMFLPFGAADPDRLTARIVVRLCGNTYMFWEDAK